MSNSVVPQEHIERSHGPTKLENRKVVKVYLSEADYKWLVLQSDGKPLSEYCRDAIFRFSGKAAEAIVESVQRAPVERTVEKVEPLSRKRYCRHGLAFCRACQELEGMEAR